MPLPTIFDPSGVSDVKLLKYGKVYLLTMGDGSELVIKAESQQFQITDRIAERKKMDFGFQIAQKVASAGNARVMDQVEVKRLARLQAAFPDPAFGWDVSLDPRYNAQTSWLLMEAASGLKNLEDVMGKGEGKQFLSLLMLFGLHQKDNLVALGKILAMDCFLGNSDRFIVDDSTAQDPIKNLGNVFFQKQSDKSFKVVGIDPMDPNSGWAKLDQDILTVTQAVSRQGGRQVTEEMKQWPGLILRSDKRMRDLAKRCLRAVNDHLMEFAKLSDKEKKTWTVRGKHFDLVEKGIKKGRDEIKLIARARVAPKGGRAGAPSGLMSRMQTLGWT